MGYIRKNERQPRRVYTFKDSAPIQLMAVKRVDGKTKRYYVDAKVVTERAFNDVLFNPGAEIIGVGGITFDGIRTRQFWTLKRKD